MSMGRTQKTCYNKNGKHWSQNLIAVQRPSDKKSGAHHGDEAADEAEVREVVGVDGGSRVDLQTVVVFAGVLEETVHGVEHLVGQQEEPFPAEGRGDVKVGCGRGRREEEQEEASSSPRGCDRNSRRNSRAASSVWLLRHADDGLEEIWSKNKVITK